MTESVNDGVINEVLGEIDNSILELISNEPELSSSAKLRLVISYRPKIKKPNKLEIEKLTQVLFNNGWEFEFVGEAIPAGYVKFSITEI